jgi:hypothetical protein
MSARRHLLAAVIVAGCSSSITRPPVPAATPEVDAAGGSSPSLDAPAASTPIDSAAAAPDAAADVIASADGGCLEPAIDGYQLWLASGEGATKPARGSILIPEGDHLVARVSFLAYGWHVLPVHLANDPDAGMVDLTKSSGFTLTYSAAADFYVQLRSMSHWDGGSQYVTKIPGTGGQLMTKTFSFAKADWTVIANLGVPGYPYETVLPEARALVFIGNGANELVFTSLHVDGYSPPCVPPRKHG